MTSRQIEYFLAVVRNQSFTKAAEELYLSQPAISRHISELEVELGVQLFDRTGRRTSLTPAGELFHAFFENSRVGLEDVTQRARMLADDKTCNIHLGVLSGWDLDAFLPRVFNGFMERCPEVTVTIETHGFRALCSALRSGRIDAAVAMDVLKEKVQDVSELPLTETKRMLIFSGKHPCAQLEKATAEDFRDEIFFAAGEDGAQAAEFIREYCRPYGFSPKVQVLPNKESLLVNVRNGVGVAIMGSWSQACSDSRFRAIPLNSNHKISLIWKKGSKHPALPSLVHEFSKVFNG